MAAEVRAVEADIPMGMTQVEDGDTKVLFIRDEHGLRAFQAKCPHLGAPLAKGEICGSTLYCPWHKAAFNIGDGSLIEPPALEGLAQYPISNDGEKVVVTLEPMATSKPSSGTRDNRTFVIVGTGAAAVAAVKTLRYEGFDGTIKMVGREKVAPYDRTKLSKQFLAKPTEPDTMILEEDFYAAHGVEAVDGPAATIDVAAKTVTLENGMAIKGDALLVATGSRAVVPSIEGADLGNIFTLRSLADAAALSEAAASGKTVAIVGDGFIGLEAAAFLTKRGLAATVISPAPLPFATRFGDDIAHALKVYHEGTGVRFVQGSAIKFEGSGVVEAVRLEGGDTVSTDLVLLAVGAAPEVECITGAQRHESGGVLVDAELKAAPGVWLAGDIAAFPESNSGTTARIEHWRLAEQHGMHAARGMLGLSAPFESTPFFWSNQGDKRLDYAGFAPDWDRIVTKGNPAALDFISFFVKDGKALAACAIGQNPEMIAFIHLLAEDRLPPTDQLENRSLASLI